jgi:hypothetical protein
VGGSCEQGNEPSSSIKCCEIPELAAQLAAYQEEVRSIELVS